MSLPPHFFHDISALRTLTYLALRCDMAAEAWEEAAAFVAAQPLQTLTLNADCMPAAAACRLFEAVGVHSSLGSVKVQCGVRLWSTDERQRVGNAVGEAFLRSGVLVWELLVQLCLAAFVRTWAARPPHAAVRVLRLPECDGSRMSDEDGALLLSCLRSCSSLQSVKMTFVSVQETVIDKLVAAVQAVPISPKKLVVRVQKEVRRKYAADMLQLREVGLVLS
eukprot:PLAT232.1.p1 GENE.PLAT232.1~~PLAT232.1.p1  ORF type:complete len:243 (-),score=63.03 PLAT232.1:57-722(-)